LGFHEALRIFRFNHSVAAKYTDRRILNYTITQKL